MKLPMKRILLLLSAVNPILYASAGITPGTSDWSSSPFDQKVFVENKSQFDGSAEKKSGNILFGAALDGVECFFSKNGLTYKHSESVPMTEEEREKSEPSRHRDREEKEEQEEVRMKFVPHYVSMEWIGSNPDVHIISEEPVSFYYTYSHGIKASAFRKIIYKNLYPNIDVEYVFPSDSSGIKYSLILHPGSDPADIKMKWNGEGISVDSNGNLIIKSSFGDFIDHAPQTFYADNHQAISSSFSLRNNEVSFSVVEYQNSSSPSGRQGGVVIDPWTSNPTFSMNKAYDVNYDYNGNVYVYGSWSPAFQLAKFNSGGALQWVYNAVLMMRYTSFYGDFAVDPFTGASYLGEGCDEGFPTAPAMVIKVNTAGQFVDSVKISTGPWQFEIWRMDFDICTRRVLAAGGGINPSSPQATLLDINLGIVTSSQPVFAAANDVDVALCTIDKYSNGTRAFMLPNAMMSLNPRPYDNALKQVMLPGLTGGWLTPTNHLFTELGSLTYVGPPVGATCSRPVSGFNGIAASQNFVYTYDSDSLKRWNKITGAAAGAIDASPAPAVIGNPGNFCFAGFVPSIQTSWGGLDVDECDNNVYVGVDNTIRVFDASMNLINTYNLPNKVYDVKLGINDKLYACGNGFVTQIDLAPSATTTITYSVTQTPATGCNNCDGTAFANAVGTVPCGPPPVFTYLWSPGGQTTQSISGLCPGTYSVAISRNCAIVHTETVLITGGGTVSVTATSTPDNCAQGVGSVTATVSSGTAPYTYSWSPSGGTNASASGLSPGNYSVTVTSANGCTAVTTVSVSTTGSLTATAGPNSTICNGQGVIINSTGGGNYLWSNGQTTSTINVTPPNTTTYSVVVSSGGCKDTAFATVLVNPVPVAAATGGMICAGQTAALTASGGGTYSWSNGSTNPNINVSPTTNTSYSVVVTVNGCSDTATAAVAVNPLPVISVPASTICVGDVALLTASGAAGYSWSTGAVTNPISVTPPATTSYTVTGTDGNGCTNSVNVTVTVSPPPIASANSDTICVGQSAVLTATGGGNYLWNNGNTTASITISPTANATYTVIVSIGTCLDTATGFVMATPSPVVGLGNNVTLCAGQPFTLDAGSNPGAGYFWNTGETTQTIIVSGVGTYWVIAALNNCFDKDTVSTFLAPQVDLYDSSLCTTSPIILDPGAGATSYLWSNGSTTQTISVEEAGSYWVVAMFGNCLSSDSSQITGDGFGGDLFVPNAFTPNTDDLNEIFLAQGTGIMEFDMTVFDRWGNMLFESQDINKGWDGRIDGGHYPLKKDGKEVSQEDVYIWRVDYTTQCTPKNMRRKIGIISIVK